MIVRNSDPVILTATGRYVSPLDLRVEDIDIVDVAHHLAAQSRFSGATRKPYSVAQHSVHVAQLLRNESVEVQMAGLLHDAQEYVLQDCVRPLKEDPYFGKAYRGAEARAEKIVAERFNLIYPHPQAIKVADVQMLAAERRDLLPPDGDWEVLHGVVAPDLEVVPWGHSRAKKAFLRHYEKLEAQR